MTQSVTHFAREVTLPLTLGILIDTSPSVQDILPLEQRAAIEFLRTVLKKNDLAMIINFDRSVSLIQDFTNSLSLLEKAVGLLAISGGTSLHDAVFLACDEKLRHESGRKAIVLISDGGDTTSKLKIREAIESRAAGRHGDLRHLQPDRRILQKGLRQLRSPEEVRPHDRRNGILPQQTTEVQKGLPGHRDGAAQPVPAELPVFQRKARWKLSLHQGETAQ